MSDIGYYGESEIAGGYYAVRRAGGTFGGEYAVGYHIDGLGEAIKVSVGQGGWTPEEIAALPTLEEAVAQHLAPAFEEMERNRQKWLDSRKDAPPEPEPEPLDPATERFFSDAPGVEAWW